MLQKMRYMNKKYAQREDIITQNVIGHFRNDAALVARTAGTTCCPESRPRRRPILTIEPRAGMSDGGSDIECRGQRQSFHSITAK